MTTILVRVVGLLGKRFRLPLLTRYAAFLDIGSGVSQVSLFEKQLLPHYPPGTRFVVLALNMDHMSAGQATLNYESQLWQLLEVRKRHPDTCLPFLCIDPRMGSAEQNLAFVKKWLCRGFVGLKLYPSLGFFPFDERLDLVYEYAQLHQVPVLTHCSRGGIYYQGELTHQLRWPQLPADLLPQIHAANPPFKLGDNSLPLPVKPGKLSFRNDHFSDLLLEPRLYDLVLARFPELKLCLAHYGGGDEIAAELKNPEKLTPTAPPTNWYQGVRWLMRKYPNVYTDVAFTLAEGTTAVFRGQPKDILFETLAQDLQVDSPYQDRLLFGTDFFLVSRLQPEKTLAGELTQYLLQTGPTGAKAWQHLATDNPARFLHSSFYTPVERRGQPVGPQPYTPNAEPGLTPLPRAAVSPQPAPCQPA
ncbi:amidohydrolase family protein [Hymenobacter cellulosilyticus]|uniref:Amidohydrolase family protein n=1 Tax=Hymenobacter cellulosilyticus TaxID=2932248 RepID=A0A8T9Q994_9BACT|nr:amidohydrolase family protein [Hymenobacter cellulosilyticus]UOQ73562.1 amidohydrolase family protein [Hymenobacter cellulosilyticus]